MERITGALAAVRNPRTGADVMAAEMVRDIATTVDGKVRLIQIKGIDMEAEFGPHMLYITNEDKPGFIGARLARCFWCHDAQSCGGDGADDRECTQ